jgi:hypothetical protein
MQGKTRIIPTTYKAKIPSTVSWPIGAQELSDVLAEVPQFEELRLSFSFYMTQKAALNHWPWMEVMRFDYRKWTEREWAISVSAIPRSERKRLHDALVQELPKASRWLVQHHARQAMGRLSFKIIWDKQKDVLYTSLDESAETERITLHQER